MAFNISFNLNITQQPPKAKTCSKTLLNDAKPLKTAFVTTQESHIDTNASGELPMMPQMELPDELKTVFTTMQDFPGVSIAHEHSPKSTAFKTVYETTQDQPGEIPDEVKNMFKTMHKLHGDISAYEHSPKSTAFKTVYETTQDQAGEMPDEVKNMFKEMPDEVKNMFKEMHDLHRYIIAREHSPELTAFKPVLKTTQDLPGDTSAHEQPPKQSASNTEFGAKQDLPETTTAPGQSPEMTRESLPEIHIHETSPIETHFTLCFNSDSQLPIDELMAITAPELE